MRFTVAKSFLISNIRESLRKCGYFGLENRYNGQLAYVRRLSQSQHYPRFHLYLEENPTAIIFNLHLDQKQASYQGARAHSAEYSDDNVKEEANRIKSIIEA